jgi:hypothetical protein
MTSSEGRISAGVERAKFASILADVCGLIEDENLIGAGRVLTTHYPFHSIKGAGRNFTKLQSLRIFLRDGFIDRYSGDRLVFPGVLRVLSLILPQDFPYHPHWKMEETHVAYWQLSPTVDHVVPLARGGANNEANVLTTSMLRNSAKSNWMLEELGWVVHQPGLLSEWDGLVGWFVRHVERKPQLLNHRFVKAWHGAALGALKDFNWVR